MAEIKVRKHDIQEAKRPDAVLQGATSTFDWLLEHRNGLLGGLLGVLVLVGAISLFQSLRDSKTAETGSKLADAIALDARSIATAKPDEPKPETATDEDPPFATQADKDKALQAALAAVTKDYANTTSAKSASLLLASTDFTDGKYDDAVQLANGYVTDSEGGTLKPFALETLGNAYAAKNDIAKAEDTYKQLGEAGQPAQALFLRATLQEKSGKIDEAKKLYEQVIADYEKDKEKDAIAKEAHTRLDLLALPPAGVGNLAAPPEDAEKAAAKETAKAAAKAGKKAPLKLGKPGGK